jgi:Ca2+-binding RTX toxin-like protein
VTLTVVDEQDLQSDPHKLTIRLDDLLTVGTDGTDHLVGSDRSDGIAGREGDDSISGGAGNDIIDGGAGRDVIDGGAGNDIIFGGTGPDELTGGSGADRFNIGSLIFGTETVRDFNSGAGDRLDLSDMFEDTDYKPGISNDADFFKLTQIDADGDGRLNDIRVTVDLDGQGRDFTSQSVAVLKDPSGVTASSPIDSVVTTHHEQASNGATS